MKGFSEPGVYDVRIKTTTKDGEVCIDYEMEWIGTAKDAKEVRDRLKRRSDRCYGEENIVEIEFSCRLVSSDS